jgi:hypothetical protein
MATYSGTKGAVQPNGPVRIITAILPTGAETYLFIPA